MAHESRRWDEKKEASWNTVQLVQPGETFTLFHPARNGTTLRYVDGGSFGGMASRIRLQTGLLDPLNLSLVATPYALPRAAVITPFDFRLGYPLDQADFTWRSRYKKLSSMKSELSPIVQGLGLTVFGTYAEQPLREMLHALPKQDAEGSGLEIASLVKRIYLMLIFPDGVSFTAQGMYHTHQLFLLFRTFFPTDTGPLPVGEPLPKELASLNVAEGFQMMLPFEPEKVQALRGRFLVLGEREE